MAESDQGAKPKFKRSAKNYLLDPHFQLKYTSVLVAIALVLSVTLGALLWWASGKIVDQTKQTLEQSTETVKQGESTVARGKQVRQSRRRIQLNESHHGAPAGAAAARPGRRPVLGRAGNSWQRSAAAG